MSPLRRIFANHRPVSAALPVEHCLVRPGQLTFGLPWPWQEDTTPGLLVDAAGNHTGQRALASVYAPRSQGEAAFLVWPNDGVAALAFDQLQGQLQRMYGVGSATRRDIRLGGQRAVLADLTSGGWHVSRLISASPRGYVLNGEFRVPESAALGYRPHLLTMVATWQWL
jgi:hypothetical protein